MKTRIITAIIGLLIFLPFVLYGEWPFVIFIYLIGTIGLFEMLKMKRIPIVSFPSIVGVLLLWTFLFNNYYFELNQYIPLSKSEILYALIFILLAYTVLVKNRFSFDDVSFVLLSSLYVGIGFGYLILTREAGLEYILFALLIIWLTDTGAYFAGRAFGKHKLWPIISPKKTIEGFFGGVIGAIIVAVILQVIFNYHEHMLLVVFVSIVASVLAQVGDLIQSAFKRIYDIKDTGHILPGHGGILDRFDSLIFMVPFLHFIQFIQL
ncbi:phosphatidate cytidylyltransferase [Aquisalibacillus elongatus]|uniref:Phosphatidate cytidylyltransferase n=1 Tax=Aquisalibacillus elongatus TaxID=485577 RepID=A0A3N5C8S7_9BACI|nr:phosphatidate cytidylyltransferase [Aquisalibacillus elongatus]RPF55962.1 phosphatidate cytidylyltransferase [Aquisalibacillus elongatus]